ALANRFLHVRGAGHLLADATLFPDFTAADLIRLLDGHALPAGPIGEHAEQFAAARVVAAVVAGIGARIARILAARAPAIAARIAASVIARIARLARADLLPARVALALDAVLLGDPLAALALHGLHRAARLADRPHAVLVASLLHVLVGR